MHFTDIYVCAPTSVFCCIAVLLYCYVVILLRSLRDMLLSLAGRLIRTKVISEKFLSMTRLWNMGLWSWRLLLFTIKRADLSWLKSYFFISNNRDIDQIRESKPRKVSLFMLYNSRFQSPKCLVQHRLRILSIPQTFLKRATTIPEPTSPSRAPSTVKS